MRKLCDQYNKLSAMNYTVAGGETLKTIARNVLGDAGLWWRIAQANGLSLSGDGQLQAGQTLSIPKLALNANNADSFQPYDPSRITGSTDPSLPAPAAQGGSSGGGCGGMGKIIMAAVAVVVAINAPYLLAQMGGSLFVSGSAVTPLGAAAGAAAGSIASQVAGNAMGVQDGFSWKSVGLSALSAGIANGLNTPALMGGSGWQDTALRMAATNTLTQGIGVATGLQRSFDWRGVAASAAGGAVGSQVAGQLKDSSLFSDWSSTAANLARGTLGGLAAGTTAAVARGGRISMQQVATDAFGNALGSSLANASTGTEQQAHTNKELYSLSSSGDGWTGLRLGSGEGLRYSGMRAGSIQDDFRPSPVEGLGASGPDAIGQAYEYMQTHP